MTESQPIRRYPIAEAHADQSPAPHLPQPEEVTPAISSDDEARLDELLGPKAARVLDELLDRDAPTLDDLTDPKRRGGP